MTTLYHGSYTEVMKPEMAKGRTKVDFGQGFYLTTIRKQAEKWAQVIAVRKGPLYSATVNIYNFDDEIFKSKEYNIKHFPEYNIEWLDYVIDCRAGGILQNQYDIIEGGVANDNVIDTVEDYENGVITAEQALGQLRYKEVNHQICIRNQNIIDDFLKYSDNYKL